MTQQLYYASITFEQQHYTVHASIDIWNLPSLHTTIHNNISTSREIFEIITAPRIVSYS